MKIWIGQACDGFEIRVNGKSYRFSQEETVEGLVEVFKELGIEDVEYEEIY